MTCVSKFPTYTVASAFLSARVVPASSTGRTAVIRRVILIVRVARLGQSPRRHRSCSRANERASPRESPRRRVRLAVVSHAPAFPLALAMMLGPPRRSPSPFTVPRRRSTRSTSALDSSPSRRAARPRASPEARCEDASPISRSRAPPPPLHVARPSSRRRRRDDSRSKTARVRRNALVSVSHARASATGGDSRALVAVHHASARGGGARAGAHQALHLCR